MANKGLDKTAYWIVNIGALNWGLYAINPSWDVVAMIGNATTSIVATIVYALVGLSGLWAIYTMLTKK